MIDVVFGQESRVIFSFDDISNDNFVHSGLWGVWSCPFSFVDSKRQNVFCNKSERSRTGRTAPDSGRKVGDFTVAYIHTHVTVTAVFTHIYIYIFQKLQNILL